MSIERIYFQIISPERRFYHWPAYGLLCALAFVYRLGHTLHLWAYKVGVLTSRRLDCRVISVGNLTLGGTGKTPVVMMVADILREQGRKPAVLSRGYKGSSSREVNIVCDGKTVLLTPEEAGDEPVMIARKLKNVPVITGPSRYQTGSYALKHFDVDTLILDDGFQHLALHRDVNILLFDHRRPLGNGALFPAGELREPAGESRRADLICITRWSETDRVPDLNGNLPTNVPVIKTVLRLDKLVDLKSGESQDAGFLQGRAVAAFCGVADPNDFRRLLDRACARVVHYQAFPDHHAYAPAELKAFESAALQAGAEYILTTEKDAVKLEACSFSIPFYRVAVHLEILEGREAFSQKLLFGRDGVC